MRVGIVSENFKNDSKSLKFLFEKKFSSETVVFIPILKQVEGDSLLRPRVAKLIEQQINRKNLNLIILAKDLDGLPSEKEKIIQLKKKSKDIQSSLSANYLLFLVIFELEALILADVDTFKKIYNIPSYQFKKNPIFLPNPKEELKRATTKAKKQYEPSDVAEIFQQLNFDKVYQNHKGENSFQSFIDKLEKAII